MNAPQRPWHTHRELVLLVAHWLTDTGVTVTAGDILRFLEHPERYDTEWRACMADLAAGKERSPVPPAPPVKRMRARRPVVFSDLVAQARLFDAA